MASQALRSIRQLPARPAARSSSQAALRARQQLQSPQCPLPHSGRYAGNARCLLSRTFARQQSTSQRPRPQPPKPGQVPSVGAILRKGLDFRPAFSFFGRGGLRKLFRQNPGELVLALAILAGLAGIGTYTVYLYFAYFNDSQFTQFPPDVANSLRRALYYTNIKPDSKLAVKYYRRAIEQCGDHGMDPYSDEVLGIRIQTAAWLEKIGNFDGAIKVLGGVVKDILRWVDWMEKGIEDGSLPRSGKVPIPKRVEEGGPEQEGQAVANLATAEGQKDETPEEEEEQEYLPENLWRKRTRLLAKAVGTSTKLGELNSSEYVLQPDESQYRLTWAVETALKELKRRHDEGVKEDEGPWLSAPEIGGALEALASNYESKSQFQLVVPLLFHALRLCESPCHRPVLMNNIATAFAQHPAGEPITVNPQAANPSAENQAPPEAASREQLLQFAHNWASNAYTHAVDVKGDDRTEECDEACAVALCNLGDISLMLKRPAEARAHFERCAKMSKDLGFADGVRQAKAGLSRVKAESS